MTLLSENVAMKPKAGIISANLSSGPVHSKQNARMAINKSLTTKKTNEGIVDVYARGTVLVSNLNAPHRNQMSNARTVASGNKNINIPSNELLRCKRKIHFISGQSYPGAQPASVARRNARERNRVKQVNNGFATLRSHIPPSVAAALTSEKSSPRNSTASKKLSKVETLKMAVEYIRSLQQMLEDHNNSLEKKSVIDQNGYEKQYEMDENYYSGSPVNGNPLHLGNTNQPFPENHCKVFPKIEPIDAEYFSTHRQFLKSESDVVFVKNEIYQAKSEHFNQDLHETLTSEFYTARSPVKSYYINQEESAFKNPDPSSIESLVSDKLAFGGQVSEVPDQSPQKIECAKRSKSPNLTVLNSVSANQVMQFSGQSFLRPQCRSSASLSPTVSDACPSPTPSYSSDQSSVHQSSVVSGSSGHLISGMTHLSTHIVSGDSFKMTSPVSRPTSPKCVTPPRTLSPLSGNSVSIVPDPSSPSNHSSYSANLEFQKGSPEGYDNYDNVSPEDEELLDVISWWQQSH